MCTKMSTSKIETLKKIGGLCQCQFPDCDSILQFCNILPLGELGEKYKGFFCINSYNFMCIYNYLSENFN